MIYNFTMKNTRKKISRTQKNISKNSSPIRPATANRAKKQSSQKAPPEINRQARSVLFLGLGILIFFLLIIPGKNIWFFLRNLLFGLFSKGAYLLPIIFIYIAYIYDKDNNKNNKNNKKIFNKCVWLFIFICTIIQILFGAKITESENIIEFIITAFNDGIDKVGGGLISAIIAWPLLKFLGFEGAVALTFVFIFILVMVISKITLSDLFKAACKPAKKLENIYSEKYSNKNKIKNKNINIDIPLDDINKNNNNKIDELPNHPVESNNKNSFYQEFDFNNSKTDNQETQDINFFELDNNNQDLEILDLNNNNQDLEILDLNNNNNQDLEILDLNNNNQDSEILDLNNNNQDSEFLNFNNIDDLIKTKINNNFNNNLEIKSNSNTDTVLEENKNINKNIFSQAYIFPNVGLLKQPQKNDNSYDSQELKNTAQILVETLKSFGVTTQLLDFSKGPTVTRYELKPAAGVKISKITGLADDIALNLAAAGVRIEAPIPNKAAVGIEIPNKTVSIVSIKEIIDSEKFRNSQSNLSVALGKDISGDITIFDIAKMPHVLIAGSTGSGKSVCINSIIISLIYKASPENVRLLMIDPKVVELGVYNDIPHLLIPVVTDPKKAAGALNWAVGEMLKRYKIFAEMSVRDLTGYNRLAKQRDDLNPLPQIVIIIDELADLMMVAPNEIEDSICRLAQMARAAGMHLIIATQRPSVDVITGIIKANIPSRIAFAVSSQVDSRTIIDSSGAEKLLGRGDMLFFPIGASKPIRVQGCFVSDTEVENVVQFVKNSYQSDYDDEISQEIERLSVLEKSKNSSSSSSGSEISDEDILSSAIECAIDNGEISASFLQRKLKLGYPKAARLIDEMEEQGIIGPKDGSKPRQTLISRQEWIEMNLNKNN
ncbi:MAG: DNA translocase FtsK [Oscillospiraceae bacterium]|nr:DNA translocase FtsK [Oscillospiraceae bacterium]